jgi:hypothetical protein
MRIALFGAAVAALLFALLPLPAAAHETRPIGKLQFVVGFMVEPPLLGQPNGIDLKITNAETKQPVEGAEKTLKAAVAFGGGAPKEFPLRARFGVPGGYTSEIIPTRAGSYIFTFTGTVGEQTVNEKFESGPGRFGDVEPTDRIQFPETVPAVGDLARQVQAADARAQTATTLAYVGAGLGVLGTVLAALALARRPRPAT